MRQKVTESHRIFRVFSPDFELLEIIVDPVIELEFSFFHLLKQRIGGHGFEGGTDQIDRFGNGQGPRPEIGVAESPVPDDFIAIHKSDGRRGDLSLENRPLDFRLQFGEQFIEVHFLPGKNPTGQDNQDQQAE